MNPNFRRYVKGAPQKMPHQKRVDCKVEITARTNKEKPIKRLESPVQGEKTPEFCVYFHARERNGNRIMSYTQSITGTQFGTTLAMWIVDNHSRLHYHPITMAKAVLKAVCELYLAAGGRDDG